MHIVTDSTADIPEGWVKEYDIDVLPVTIQFGEKTFQQRLDLGCDQFYQLVREYKMIPSIHLCRRPPGSWYGGDCCLS
jgi:fatty acid-binding protein DegV